MDPNKAAMSGAEINDLPDSAFAYIEPGGTKDETGKTVPRSLRHYPVHDEAHARNALARASAAMNMGGEAARIARLAMPKIRAACERMGIQVADMPSKAQAVKATILDDDSFRLLAIPFGGPVPYPGSPKGADIEGQWFSPATRIHPDWFSARAVDWHHGLPREQGGLGREVLGKAVDLGGFDGPSREPDEDGWWVTLWLDHGKRRLSLIKRLAEMGGEIFGSSETVPGFPTMRYASGASKGSIGPWRRGVPGEIIEWPYIRQTLSTSPQNTYSVLRPSKAVLDNLELEGAIPGEVRSLLSDLEALGSDLTSYSVATGGEAAKAGRVLSAANEAALRDALARLDEVLAKLRKDEPVAEASA